jgi:hypothetical protein
MITFTAGQALTWYVLEYAEFLRIFVVSTLLSDSDCILGGQYLYSL